MRYALSFAFSFAIIAVGAMSARAEKPVTIPLEDIWGYAMPGTRPMQRVRGSEETAADPKLIAEIRKALPYIDGKEPGKGFAVIGKGKDAFQEAHSVLVKKAKPRRFYPANTQVSAVFFAHQGSDYVYLHKAERLGKKIEIQYRYVPHDEQILSEHFAIVPLGKFSPGEVTVEINQVDANGKRIPKAGTSVSRSFSFSVK